MPAQVTESERVRPQSIALSAEEIFIVETLKERGCKSQELLRESIQKLGQEQGVSLTDGSYAQWLKNKGWDDEHVKPIRTRNRRKPSCQQTIASDTRRNE